jgi:hypothetical protein
MVSISRIWVVNSNSTNNRLTHTSTHFQLFSYFGLVVDFYSIDLRVSWPDLRGLEIEKETDNLQRFNMNLSLCEWQWCFYLSSDDFKEEIMCFILDLARASYFVFILLNTHSKIILSFSFINISLSCTVKFRKLKNNNQ